MRILGIDPGLATLGWGVIEAQRGRQSLVEYGCILTRPEECFPDRLSHILRDMRDLLALYQPDEIAFEELFFARNVTTALKGGKKADSANGKADFAYGPHCQAGRRGGRHRHCVDPRGHRPRQGTVQNEVRIQP